MASEDAPQTSRTGVTSVATQDLDQIIASDESEPIGFVDPPLDRPGTEHAGQIQNCACRNRATNCAYSRRLVVGQVARAVNPDSVRFLRPARVRSVTSTGPTSDFGAIARGPPHPNG